MMKSYKDRMELARYVSDRLVNFVPGSALTMTIKVEKLGDCSATIATTGSSGDTVTVNYSGNWRTMSNKAPDYSFPPSPKRSEEEIVADLRKGFEKSWLLSQTKEKDAGLE